VWVDLPGEGHPTGWLNGEPKAFNATSAFPRWDAKGHWYQIGAGSTNGWFLAADSLEIAGFIAEWDQ